MSTEQIMEGAPLTLREAAAYLKISPNTLYKWTSRGTISFFKPGGRVCYFKKSDLDDWVFRNRNVPAWEMTEQTRKGGRP